MNNEQVFNIEKEQELLVFLLEKFKELSRKKIKALLGSGLIYVNGKSTTQFNYLLKPSDKVIIKRKVAFGKVFDSRLKIIEETENYLVVDKPAGLLSVSTPKERNKTMFHIVSQYVKGQNPKNKIFIVHRLDKDTSGLLLFAKNEATKQLFQKDWNQIVKRREYLTIVEGEMEQSSGVIKSYLTDGKEGMVYETKDSTKGQLAITEFKKIKTKNNMTWLEINLKTGRKNQIRVQLSSLQHPVVGDKKYHSTLDPFHRLALHQHRLIIIDPVSKEVKEWISEIPNILK